MSRCLDDHGHAMPSSGPWFVFLLYPSFSRRNLGSASSIGHSRKLSSCHQVCADTSARSRSTCANTYALTSGRLGLAAAVVVARCLCLSICDGAHGGALAARTSMGDAHSVAH
eukprot:scaffold20869_cov120-Isochrysis_galbana.AAC.3